MADIFIQMIIVDIFISVRDISILNTDIRFPKNTDI